MFNYKGIAFLLLEIKLVLCTLGQKAKVCIYFI